MIFQLLMLFTNCSYCFLYLNKIALAIFATVFIPNFLLLFFYQIGK